jgi:hypothetical protein
MLGGRGRGLASGNWGTTLSILSTDARLSVRSSCLCTQMGENACPTDSIQKRQLRLAGPEYCHWPPFLVVQGHAQRILGPVHHEVGMFPSKSLSHVTAPADGPVCAQHLLQLLGRDLVPLDRLAVRIQESRRVVMPVDFSERFVAIRALLSLIPPIDDRPN